VTTGRSEIELSLLTTQFVNQWVAQNPTVPVKYENRNFTQPDSGVWVAFGIDLGAVVDNRSGVLDGHLNDLPKVIEMLSRSISESRLGLGSRPIAPTNYLNSEIEESSSRIPVDYNQADGTK
jgi:hypothetical protein